MKINLHLKGSKSEMYTVIDKRIVYVGGSGGRDICKLVTDAYCCTAEAGTEL